jgi:NAD+ synthase (glutamine-hydrolysing)
MPSKVSSFHSKDDAYQLAQNLKIHFRTEPIQNIVDQFNKQLNLKGLAANNIQARVRGAILMSISNTEGQLVLATGNKSECMVGYSTIYGDTVGGYAPISYVYKVDVWGISKYRNEYAKKHGLTMPIPKNSIDKEPSAELYKGQTDKDKLPDYFVLDKMLMEYEKTGLESALTPDILKMVKESAWKLNQAAPGTKI